MSNYHCDCLERCDDLYEGTREELGTPYIQVDVYLGPLEDRSHCYQKAYKGAECAILTLHIKKLLGRVFEERETDVRYIYAEIEKVSTVERYVSRRSSLIASSQAKNITWDPEGAGNHDPRLSLSLHIAGIKSRLFPAVPVPFASVGSLLLALLKHPPSFVDVIFKPTSVNQAYTGKTPWDITMMMFRPSIACKQGRNTQPQLSFIPRARRGDTGGPYGLRRVVTSIGVIVVDPLVSHNFIHNIGIVAKASGRGQVIQPQPRAPEGDKADTNARVNDGEGETVAAGMVVVARVVHVRESHAVATSDFADATGDIPCLEREAGSGTKPIPTPKPSGFIGHHHMLPDSFTTGDGDVILRAGPVSGIRHDFRVHKLVLSLASRVFKDLFQAAQPDDSQKDLLPVVTITDPPESVDLLLRFIYPGLVPPTITDLPVLSALLTIADKYDVPTISPVVKRWLADKEILGNDPFGVYVVARHWGFSDEAKGAARGLTLAKIAKSPYSKDPQNIAKEDFLRLLWFMQKREAAAKKVIRTFLVTWNHDPDLGPLACGRHSGEQARKFYEGLAEVVVSDFDVDPCLDGKEMVMALMRAPDPPQIGFCGDGNWPPELEAFHTHCPLRTSSMVSVLSVLALELERICVQYLSKAMDGTCPV
ncbi:hypothetical protein BDM02DRAFT_3128376 [Thelephora ganbajun]|uniref:Uncharacterized protein n=1 Tax=Thelephora ganbajun TaxID=370292 RepID=A0ACB6ZIL1_THEGA|nr:hypothetical protein BDM02DRAFT_3128376 [Thelephora ganbajun]